MKHLVSLSVPNECNAARLDIFLAQSLRQFTPSRTFASEIIQQGRVAVNNSKQTKSSYRLKTSQVVEVDLTDLEINADAPPQAERLPLDILFEDKDILVIDKKAGMVVHPGAGRKTGTLVNAVLGHCGQTLPSLGNISRAGIVHRLDKDTSGVMVVAKSQQALTRLSQQFAAHAQTRIYHALVHGIPQPSQNTVKTWHGRDQRNRLKFAVQLDGTGKIAMLFYTTLQVFQEVPAFSLLSCQLKTGRTHQIRVQMAHIGHPVVGDTTYGKSINTNQHSKENLLFLKEHATRQLLHAFALGFKHPTTEKDLFFCAPHPCDFSLCLQKLSKRGCV